MAPIGRSVTATDVHGQNYSNNPDPAVLLPAMQRIGDWITKQGGIARDAAKGDNVVPIKAQCRENKFI